MNITKESEDQINLKLENELEPRDFGSALTALKNGYRLTRESWDNKEIYITLSKDKMFYITNFGKIVNYLPKEDELLAEDWTIVDNKEQVN